MSYSTNQDVLTAIGEAELIQLTDRPERADPQNAGTIDYALLAAKRADATEYIHRYIRKHLPLAFDPPEFRKIEIDILRYQLYTHQITDAVKYAFEDAKAFLRDIQEGRINCPGTLDTVSGGSADTVEFSAAPSVFGRDAY